MFQQAGDLANFLPQPEKRITEALGRRRDQNLLQVANVRNGHGEFGTCTVQALRGRVQEQGMRPDQRFARAGDELAG